MTSQVRFASSAMSCRSMRMARTPGPAMSTQASDPDRVADQAGNRCRLLILIVLQIRQGIIDQQVICSIFRESSVSNNTVQYISCIY